MPFSVFGYQLRFLSRRKFIMTLFVILSLGVILQIWVMNRMATFGEQLTGIEQTKSELTMENQILENQIAQASSLQTIKFYASNLGFRSISKVTYVHTPDLASNN
jgi:hypothetical protein